MDLLYDHVKKQQELQDQIERQQRQMDALTNATLVLLDQRAGIVPSGRYIADVFDKSNTAGASADPAGAFMPPGVSAEARALMVPGAAGMPIGVAGPAGAPVIGGETAVVGHHNTVNQIRTNVTIQVFGQEKTDHITPPDILQMLERTPISLDPVSAAVKALADAAMLIYSDPEHPENITCYIPNKKRSEALVHGERGWDIRPVQVILPEITFASTRLLTRKAPLPGLPGCDRMQDYTEYEELYKALVRNANVYEKGKGQLEAVLVRNKALLERALATLPVAGEK